MKDKFIWEADVIPLLESMVAECALIFRYKQKLNYIGDFIYNRANIGIFMSLVIGDVSRTEGFFQALGIQ